MNPLPITSELSRRMSVMGFLCACMVVMIHTTPVPEPGTVAYWLAGLFWGDGLCRIAIPYFFFASGFFLAGHFNEEGWWRREVGKRVRSLVVPFFVWQILYRLIDFVLWYGAKRVGYSCDFKNPFAGPIGFQVVSFLGIHPFVNVPLLWFLRDLFFLVVASPVLLWALRRMKLLFPIGLFAVYLLFLVVGPHDEDWYNFFEYFVSLRGIAYFTLGLAVRLQILRLPSNAILPLILGICLLVAKVVFQDVGGVAALLDFCMVIPLGMGLFAQMRRVSLPKLLTSSAFPLYLVHIKFVFLTTVILIVVGLRGQMDESIPIALARGLFAVAASVLFAFLVRELAPRLSQCLFGGR